MLLERDSPLGVLETLVERARDGHGSVALVSGEAGIGKTSLLREFAQRRRSDVRVLWGGCEALFTPRPLGPVRDIAGDLDPHIADLIERGATPGDLFPALLNAVKEARHTTVLVFEDVHWADHGTLDLVKYLGRRISLLRALLLLSVRGDEVGADHGLTQVIGDLPSEVVTRITLQPLTANAVAALARAAHRSAENLHQITAGNPFFVTELLATAEGGEVPASVADAVWARLARLDAREREALETMSVVPGAIQLWLLRAVLGSDADSAIARCVARGLLVRDDGGTLRFRHELARQATLARLPPAAQKALHRRFEAAISSTTDKQSEISLSQRVQHAAGAEDGARVLELAPLAAKEAARLGAHREAASHLAAALAFVAGASRALAAQLHEDWAYEAGLALGIDDKVIDARRRALQLWRAEGRTDKVGHNLRWLSRLHWYRGEAKEAGLYADEAIRELEAAPVCPELAMAYSARSQLHMLNDRMNEAIEWGERAIALAEKLGETDTKVHALNNVGTALLFSGRAEGREKLEGSLALALKHGFHEHAARAYTNLSEYAVVFKDFVLAERMLAEGIAFDTRHDLDAWTHYLVGRQAQLRLEQGRLREAETIASGVLQLKRLTLVMRLPALTVLGRTRMRLGERDASEILQRALSEALATGEPQNIVPVRFALVEAAWLGESEAAVAEQLALLRAMNVANFDPWESGELAVWLGRSSLPADDRFTKVMPRPRALELAGKPEEAAAEWQRLGLPYEAALSLMQVRGDRTEDALIQAVTLLDDIEAGAAAARARGMARRVGILERLPKQKRGPYSAARAHPLGLTKRECEVLQLLVGGAANAEIAKRLSRSQRTVEHHVSAVLAKLSAGNRMEAMLRVRSEPWLISAPLAPR
jgi:DNA-binding CsgD family transcriptional regulator/tetratricopeptide (TPR) repeat protein